MTSVCQDEKATSPSSNRKQDIQTLIRLYCILWFCTSSPAAISAQGMQNIWPSKNICCDGRKEASSNAGTEAATRDTEREHYFPFSVIHSHVTGYGLCPNNGAITVCQISNPTHPQQRQDASKRPQPSCWEWVAALTLLSALSWSPGAHWGWSWAKELRLYLAMRMRPGYRKGAGGGDWAQVIDRTGAEHCWNFCLKGRWRMGL